MSHGYGPEDVPAAQMGRGRVFERGGIKFAILALLKDKPRYGYDIIRAMEEQSGGMYSPSPGASTPPCRPWRSKTW